MAKVSYGGRAFAAQEEESVLDCLARNEVNIPHACRSGVCQSCLIQVTAGDIPAAGQAGLKAAYKKRGLALACQLTPEHDITVCLPDAAGIDTRATVAAVRMLNHNVMLLGLVPDGDFPCEPGQYISLITAAGLARSYSVANDPIHDRRIELHIRLLRDGQMSGYLKNNVSPGDTFIVRGPAGNCFYVREEGDGYPIFLAGTGTGLAPLYGIARQALAHGHRGPVHLFHGALHAADLYLDADLRALAERFANFRYEPCVLQPGVGDIQDAVLAALPVDKAQTRLYLCGAPEMVNALKVKAFLAGISSRHIFADAFLPSKSAPVAA